VLVLMFNKDPKEEVERKVHSDLGLPTSLVFT
jgi:hypothetical protein